MSILEALRKIPEQESIDYVKAYYGKHEPPHELYGRPFHGAYFGSLDEDFFKDTTNHITGSDLYALTLLQARVQRKPGAEILIDLAGEITQTLSQVPNIPLEDLCDEEFDKHLGEKSPARNLWDILINVHGVGDTIASKLMAKKRPHLVPIHDSFIGKVTKVSIRNNWEEWWKALTDRESGLRYRADVLREAVDKPQLSRLRVLDVMFWYSRKFGVHSK